MSFLSRLFGGKQEQRSVTVCSGVAHFNDQSTYNTNQALLYATVYRCVNLISDSVAELGIHVHRIAGGYKEEALDHTVYQLFSKMPTKRMTRYMLMKNIVVSMLMTGNAYVYIKRNEDKTVKELIYIPSNYVSVYQKNWYDPVIYKVTGTGEIKSEDMLHFQQYPSNDGAQGISVLQHARLTMGLVHDQNKTASGFFKSGGAKSGVISSDRPITDDQEQQILERWRTGFNGDADTRSVVVLKPGMKYEPITINAADAELLDSRKFSVIEICRYFGVSPQKCFDTDNQSYSTIEATNIAFLTDTLQPIITKIEDELNAKLWAPFEDNMEIKFDTSVLLRTDKTALSNYYRNMFNIGALTINEIRKAQDMPPVENGDIPMLQVNISTLDKIVSTPIEENPQSSDQLSNFNENISQEDDDDTDTDTEE